MINTINGRESAKLTYPFKLLLPRPWLKIREILGEILTFGFVRDPVCVARGARKVRIFSVAHWRRRGDDGRPARHRTGLPHVDVDEAVRPVLVNDQSVT